MSGLSGFVGGRRDLGIDPAVRRIRTALPVSAGGAFVAAFAYRFLWRGGNMLWWASAPGISAGLMVPARFLF